MQAGTVWINDPLTNSYAGPFGGMKMSGSARELGEDGLDSFLETKHVHWDFSDEIKIIGIRTRLTSGVCFLSVGASDKRREKREESGEKRDPSSPIPPCSLISQCH